MWTNKKLAARQTLEDGRDNETELSAFYYNMESTIAWCVVRCA